MRLSRTLHSRLTHPNWLYGLILTYLLVSWALVVALDVLNLNNWGNWFIDSASYLMMGDDPTMTDPPAPFYYVWFCEGSPVEWLQWVSLGSLIIVGVKLASQVQNLSKKLATFWMLIAITALLLLLEDAGNPRHRLTGFLGIFHPVLPSGFPLSTAFELFVYFPLLAALPVYALYRYYDAIAEYKIVKSYLWIGFGFYAIAAIMSGTSGIAGWYSIVGEWSLSFFSAHIHTSDSVVNLHFHIMDSLVEETIELLGAGALLCSAMAQRYELRTKGDCTPSGRIVLKR